MAKNSTVPKINDRFGGTTVAVGSMVGIRAVYGVYVKLPPSR